MVVPRCSLVGLVTALLCQVTIAEPDGTPVSLRNTVTHVLYSKELEQHYLIDVFLPGRYTPKTSEHQFPKHPVVFVLDSRPNAVILASQRHIAGLASEIIVGIDYADADGNPIDSFTAYTRDLTPTHVSTWQTPGSGGAEAFRRFINTTVKPLVHQTYNVDTRNQMLVGHSFGGLFGLYVLFNHTDDFDRYVISSPSLWWDNGVAFDHEAAYAKAHNDLDKPVFLSVGQREFKRGPQGMVDNNHQLKTRLLDRKYPNLSLHQRIFEDENHVSVIGVALIKGLQTVTR
ncbi:MAG: alpha/beta hydrolase-fold protein [Pseudomonadota bacterium]